MYTFMHTTHTYIHVVNFRRGQVNACVWSNHSSLFCISQWSSLPALNVCAEFVAVQQEHGGWFCLNPQTSS